MMYRRLPREIKRINALSISMRSRQMQTCTMTAIPISWIANRIGHLRIYL
jgi:hypothetical protein